MATNINSPWAVKGVITVSLDPSRGTASFDPKGTDSALPDLEGADSVSSDLGGAGSVSSDPEGADSVSGGSAGPHGSPHCLQPLQL
jgi:hypothetical protein